MTNNQMMLGFLTWTVLALFIESVLIFDLVLVCTGGN